jgi:hypothetical protein
MSNADLRECFLRTSVLRADTADLSLRAGTTQSYRSNPVAPMRNMIYYFIFSGTRIFPGDDSGQRHPPCKSKQRPAQRRGLRGLARVASRVSPNTDK